MGFDEIQGQNRAVALLKMAVKAGRVAHAYLFYGPDGVGKRKTALIFAQLLNCEGYPADEPCETCLQCRKVKTGNHPDVFSIQPSSGSLKIAQIRALQEKAYFGCYEGRFKVIMIDDAHSMTVEAANCLLKILEEPPEDTVFLLIADDPQKLPSTVLSRSQPVPFNPLDEDVIQDILAKQGIETRFPLGLARGSAGKALELKQKIDSEELLQNINGILFALQQKGYQEIFTWAETLSKSKELTEATLDLLATCYRDRIIKLAVGGRNSFQDVEVPAAVGKGLKQCYDALEEINKAVYHLKNNSNTRLVWEVLLINLRNIGERGFHPVG